MNLESLENRIYAKAKILGFEVSLSKAVSTASRYISISLDDFTTDFTIRLSDHETWRINDLDINPVSGKKYVDAVMFMTSLVEEAA